jgi:mannosyltransferase OCH1-like enzyme
MFKGVKKGMSEVYEIVPLGLDVDIIPFIDILYEVFDKRINIKIRNISENVINSVKLEIKCNNKVLDVITCDMSKHEMCYVYYNDTVNKIEKPPQETQKIPKLIWQTTSLKYLNGQMIAAAKTIIDRNTDYKYSLYLDSDIEDFLATYFDENVLSAYRKLKPGAFKADLWRYCILYINGGIYVDYKMISKQSFSEFIKSSHELVLVFSPIECIRMGFTPMYSALIAAVPRHPYIKKCIDQTVENILSEISPYPDLLGITGPNMMFNVLKKILKEEPNFFENTKILEHVNNNSMKPHMFVVTDPDNKQILFYKQFPNYYNIVAKDHYTFSRTSEQIYNT